MEPAPSENAPYSRTYLCGSSNQPSTMVTVALLARSASLAVAVDATGLAALHFRWSSSHSGGSVAVAGERNGAATTSSPHLSYWHQPGSESLLPLTMGQLAEATARRWPEREALVSLHQNKRITFAEALAQADRLAAAFHSIGLRPGDRLGLCGPNSVEWYITNMAAARAGLILVNINPAYQEAELAFCLSKVGVRALVVPDKFKTQDYHAIIQNIVPELTSCQPGKLKSKKLPHLNSVITIGNSKLSYDFNFNELMSSVSSEDINKIRELQNLIQPDFGSNLQFTSGTTGQPKGTLLSHHNIVNNGYFLSKRLKFDSKHHRICLPVPFFHCFGNVLGIIIALHSGSTLVLPAYSFKAEDSIEAIKKERCSILYGTPTMLIDIISKSEETASKYSSVEFIITAGAPAPPHLFNKIIKTFSVKKCYSVYGMTETSPLSFAPYADDSLDVCANTVGRVMDHCEVKVVNKEGFMVPMGQPGELLVRGYPNMLQYFDDHERTKEIMGTDRWLKTGDQFILEKNGYGRVVGRLKEMIIRGGENIFPREVEDYILTHSDVEDVQVVGVPDDRLGEELCACVRRKPKSELTAQELRQYCKGKIAHFKIPKYIKFMTDYPRTLSGKVQKFKLRELVIKEGMSQ